MLRESFPRPPGGRSGHPWEPFDAPKEPQPRNSQPLCSETHTFSGMFGHTPAHPPPSPLLHYNHQFLTETVYLSSEYRPARRTTGSADSEGLRPHAPTPWERSVR